MSSSQNYDKRQYQKPPNIKSSKVTIKGKKIKSVIKFNCTKEQQQHELIIEDIHNFEDIAENDTFRDIFSKKSSYKEGVPYQIELKKNVEEPRRRYYKENKSREKSKSKSREIKKSKSVKELTKKSKSLTRIFQQHNLNHYITDRSKNKKQRKSDSPHKHQKSNCSRKGYTTINYKSNYNSKTSRQNIPNNSETMKKSKNKTKIKNTNSTKHSEVAFKRQQKQKKLSKKVSRSKIIDPSKGSRKKSMIQFENKTKKSNSKKVKKQKLTNEIDPTKRSNLYFESDSQQEQMFYQGKKQLKKQSNIVKLPKKKQRLSLNSNRFLMKKQSKIKTQNELEYELHKYKLSEQQASIRIQSFYRGYIVRKYIRNALEYNAAMNIQRVYRGYIARKKLMKQKMKKLEFENIKKYKNDTESEYLLEKETPRSNINEQTSKYTSLLEEVLGDQSVNSNLKRKISQMLLNDKGKDVAQLSGEKEVNDGSKSARSSSISNRIVINEINSERNFIEKSKNWKQNPLLCKAYLSPENYHSPKILSPYHSPPFIKNRLKNHTPRGSNSNSQISPDKALQNLQDIYSYHKQQLVSKANFHKQHLNKMLIKNSLSPRTHEKKYKDIQQNLEYEITKFNESMTSVMDSININEKQNLEIENKEGNDYIVELTPRKEQEKKQGGDLPLMIENNSLKLIKYESDIMQPDNNSSFPEVSAELFDFYQNQKQLKRDTIYEPFEKNLTFIEEYLLTLMEFLRVFEDGNFMMNLLNMIKKPKNLPANQVIRNCEQVNQEIEIEPLRSKQLQSCFKLPYYKYMDCSIEFLNQQVLEEYHSSLGSGNSSHDFSQKLQRFKHNTTDNSQQIFLKMIKDCLNEAFNDLRPTNTMFTNNRLTALCSEKILQSLPPFQIQAESSMQQMQFQFICANALQILFNQHNHNWGNFQMLDQQQELVMMFHNAQQRNMSQTFAKEKWLQEEELWELIGEISESLFQIMIFEEMETIYLVSSGWEERKREWLEGMVRGKVGELLGGREEFQQ